MGFLKYWLSILAKIILVCIGIAIPIAGIILVIWLTGFIPIPLIAKNVIRVIAIILIGSIFFSWIFYDKKDKGSSSDMPVGNSIGSMVNMMNMMNGGGYQPNVPMPNPPEPPNTESVQQEN